ncbi:hypothetical protein D1BOALGB6SA_6582 [Olavius sp. associated proteobacterium Delta 1]|nr:hypothetical protein D1BOALGB6SA_6582 [Olavius sp. associated proteobacterium Delta 1]
MPKIGQIREYTLFLFFFLPRSGFVQQAVAADLLTLEAYWRVVESRTSKVFRDCEQAAASR